MPKQSQMTLAVELSDDARFENYFTSPKNQQLLSGLQKLSTSHGGDFIYLWGGESSGKSHLLQALCHQAEIAGKTSLYLSFKDAQHMSPEIFEGAYRLAMVCLDDVELVAGTADWEQALFNLYNQLKESGTTLVVSANTSALDLELGLPDLKSRLQSMLIFNLVSLSDEEKKQALQFRASKRGFELPDSVADFILARAGRGFAELMNLLDTLDSISLVEQRKLTIPLVKTTLGW